MATVDVDKCQCQDVNVIIVFNYSSSYPTFGESLAEYFGRVFKMMPLRSINNQEPAFVQFQNKTNRQVDVVWINYVGALQKYVTLKPRENINIDTYKTHPWIFVDPETGVKMRVGTRTVYYPFSNRGIRRWLGLGTEVNYRIPIPIRLPVFALREISLQTVMKLLKDIRHVDSLQLPSVLIRDIKQLHEEKDKILSSYVP